MLESKKKTCVIDSLNQNYDVISAYTVRLLEDGNVVQKKQVYFYNIFQDFSFKMNLQKSNSHEKSLHSANCTTSLKHSAIKKPAKMKLSQYLGTFIQCLSSFQLKTKLAKVKE